MKNTAIASSPKKMPNFLKLLFFVEMWERFSYYGMRALLVLFLTSQLNLADEESYAIYSLFAAIGYSLPVLGGFLADKFLGFRNMVLIGGIIITFGHLFMGFMSFEPTLIYGGLALIAVGTGMFKGNITNLLGACYKENDPDRNKGFTLFHVGVNLGSFLASLSCGYVAHAYGWEYGFSLAGIGMAMGLALFARLQHILGDAGLPNPKSPKKFAGFNISYLVFAGAIIFSVMVSKMLLSAEYFANLLAYSGAIMVAIFVYIITKSSDKEKRGLFTLLILLAFFMLFLCLEMQLGSLINLFAARNINNQIWGFTIPTAFSQGINPLSIILLGSLMSRYMKFSKKSSTKKFMFGILTMAICFFILYMGCLSANEFGKVNYIYLLLAISFMGLGELLIVPLVHEQATLLAPKHLKGLVMGMVMLSLAFSNLAGIVISKFMSIPKIDGQIDSLVSLEIYKAGFLKIALFNLGLTLLFMLFYRFVNKVIVGKK